MDTADAKAREREARPETAPHAADPDDTRDSKFGLLKITRPLDLNAEDQGGDPYNTTGRFTRIKG